MTEARHPTPLGREGVDRGEAYRLFFDEGLNLGEISVRLGCSIYALSPWLTAPLCRAAGDAALEARDSAIEGVRERLRDRIEGRDFGVALLAAVCDPGNVERADGSGQVGFKGAARTLEAWIRDAVLAGPVAALVGEGAARRAEVAQRLRATYHRVDRGPAAPPGHVLVAGGEVEPLDAAVAALLERAALRDGDEVVVTVRPTGERPLGDRGARPVRAASRTAQEAAQRIRGGSDD